MPRLGIISNPFAKMNKKYPEHNTRLWHTLANEGLYEITHSLNELSLVCQDFCTRGIEVVGIVGGDGSIGLVLSHLYQAYNNKRPLPKILVLKGGTINFLASNLGLETSALTCLRDALFCFQKNLSFHEQRVQTITVNGRLGFVFAGGLAPAFLEDFYKNKTNSWGAALALGKYVMDGVCGGKLNGKLKAIAKPQLLTIDTLPHAVWGPKGLPPDHAGYTLLLASTVPNLPLSLNIFKGVELGDASAQMLAVSENTHGLLQGAVQAFVGSNIAHREKVGSVNFKEASIQGVNNLLYSLDGDVLVAETGKIEIKLGPSFIFCSPYYIPHKSKSHQRFLTRKSKNGA